MSCYIGIDIGAISANAALLAKDDASKGRMAAAGWKRAADCKGEGALYVSPYTRTKGKPLSAVATVLEEVISAVGVENVSGVCLTGSAARLAAEKLDARVINEFRAVALGMAAMGVKVRTVFEMGGESSKYLRLSAAEDGNYGIIDYATNGDCAAGTGSFIDQQAGRLKYAIEDVGGICLQADRAAAVAGRCSVFAKSDMIHAQQKGYNPPEVLRGLCDAVARNFRTAVVRSHPIEPPVALIGGVAANRAVVQAMRECAELDEGDFFVPEHFAHVAAAGAAVAASRGEQQAGLSRMGELRVASDTGGANFPRQQPLAMDRVTLLRDRAEPADLTPGGGPVDAFLGIDIGSVSTNLVLIDTDGRVIYEIYTRTQGRPIEVVSEGLKEIESAVGEHVTIRGVGATGSGRELVGQLVGADTINDEITAHKTGATFIGRTMLDGRAPDTIFEIGGQDSKYISLQDGIVVDFTMNEACAAGTGSFLEERAEELEISIKGEFAELALSSEAPIRLGERCTVFMEHDVNSCMQRGAEKKDLVAGLAYSVVYNYINRVVRGRKIGETIFFQGGTAYNDAVAAAFAAVTGKEIIVPPHNGVMGAIGSALLAKEMMTSDEAKSRECGMRNAECEMGSEQPQVDPPGLAEGTYVPEGEATRNPQSATPNCRFRGYDLSKVDYTLREFTCKGCSNACAIQEFTVEGEKTYWGDKCSDRFRKAAKSSIKPVIEDLFSMREQWLLDETGLPEPKDGAPTIGIPLMMYALEQLPFWRTMLRTLGFDTVLSDPTNRSIVQAGLDSVVAEPCFPIIVAHGHVAQLLERSDVNRVLLASVISQDTPWMHNESHLCPWHQTLPWVVRRAPAVKPGAHKILSPIVRFREGQEVVAREMAEFFAKADMPGRLDLGKRAVKEAVAAGYAAQRAFREKMLDAGREAMHALERTGAPGVILVGRPYNIHDAGVNLSVARKLRDQYGVNCIPLDFLDLADIDVRDINENMYWDLGRRILAAAKVVGRHRNLHIIYITNFKCGPDSFIKHFIRRASGKPFLSLQFDGHSNDAGMMTRCEAYLDSKGFLRPWRHEDDRVAAGVSL